MWITAHDPLPSVAMFIGYEIESYHAGRRQRRALRSG